MGYQNREIEWKLLVEGHTSIASVEKTILPALDKLGGLEHACRPKIVGCAADTYWAPPEDSLADFVRLRILDDPDERGNLAQITAKASDMGGNVNRIEIDLGVSDAVQANKLLTLMLGDPLGQVTKQYSVFFLEDEHTTVSIYRVLRDKRVFVEVEATAFSRVQDMAATLRQCGLQFSRVPQSLFDLFVLKKNMTLEPMHLYPPKSHTVQRSGQ